MVGVPAMQQVEAVMAASVASGAAALVAMSAAMSCLALRTTVVMRATSLQERSWYGLRRKANR
jgi:hypothetical protein